MVERETTALEVPATRVMWPGAFVGLVALALLTIMGGTAALIEHATLLAGLKGPAGVAVLVVTLATLGISTGIAVRRRRRDGALRVERQALLWNGRPIAGMRQLREAVAYTNGTRHGVRLRSRWRTAYFQLGSRAEADRVVAALGKDSSQAALSVATEGAIVASAWWGMFQGFSGAGMFLRLGLTLVVGILLPYLLQRLFSRRWVVGSDGLLVRRGFGRGRFVPYADVAGLAAKRGTLTATLRDGTRLSLRSQDDSKDTPWPVIGAGALLSRIEEARAKAAARMGGEDVVAELTRGERDVGAWIAGLRGLLDRPVGYRVAAVPRERLWSALEDVTQPAEVRAAAATALGPRLAPDERPRLRVAAEACASPELRVALEAAEEDDDERLGEALKRLHAPGKG